MTVQVLTRGGFPAAVHELCAADRDLAAVVSAHGVPPMWGRSPGFSALLKIILEQQVSLASAKATYLRLRERVGRITPHAVGRLRLNTLHGCGFTRQKARYCLDLARLIRDGGLDLAALATSSDAAARDSLVSVRGIGPWTADVYLLMALRRPDIWPDGDLALAESMRVVKRMRARPDNTRMRRVAAAWHPWRSVAARILWHDYLARRR